MSTKPKVYIIIYSLYKHVYQLAENIAQGVNANGCEATVFQCEETLPDSVLEKMHVSERLDLPTITAEELANADGILFGMPTRFGLFPSQMKALLDATGKLWAQGSLGQKFVGTFFCSASQHGGQETTAWNAITYFSHHGMLYVPFGFASKHMNNSTKVIGGSAYGAGTIANGDGSRQPIPEELEIAQQQGQTFAKICLTYHRGKMAIASSLDPSKAVDTEDGAADATGTDASTADKDAIGSETGATEANTGTADTGATGASDNGPVAAVAAAVGAGVAGAGAAVASATSGTNKATADYQPDGIGPTDTSGMTGMDAPVASGGTAAAIADAPAEVPKKKSRGMWFCCGRADDLD
ncbi:flavo protein WrbA [Hesseltinella vesiculosa]|uniref:Flavo protein WrbA n=1 Tax=Hesseltinella vesiculosa TaxID=101127 RepID=A0A1X2G6A1_9FUNG|nr:flavo protein WrbA [Hesseltinella vesiculosa]